jgi:hypothetical protein
LYRILGEIAIVAIAPQFYSHFLFYLTENAINRQATIGECLRVAAPRHPPALIRANTARVQKKNRGLSTDDNPSLSSFEV